MLCYLSIIIACCLAVYLAAYPSKEYSPTPLIAFGIICVTDLLATLLLLDKNMIAEANPVLNWIMVHYGLLAMVNIKVLLDITAAMFFLTTYFYNYRLTDRVVRFITCFYVAVFFVAFLKVVGV